MRNLPVFSSLMWVALSVAFFPNDAVHAQDPVWADTRPNNDLSGEFRWGGASMVFLPVDGGMLTMDCNCRYEDISGVGVSFAAALSYRFDPSYALAARAGYRFFMPNYRQQYQSTVYAPLGDERLVTFERRAEMILQTASVEIFLRWDPHVSRFYVLAGPSLDFLVSSSFKETERILTPGIVYWQSGTNERLFHDGSLGDAMKVRKWSVGIEGTVGYTFSLGVLSLSPEIGFRFPLNGFSPSHSSWKMTEIRGGITVETPW
ncbi:MAG: outer membrane beta-barrel protein [Bacteroidota bacterium]|nr:outer membrane beta-barrel protein [Bacteroidota bacterium]